MTDLIYNTLGQSEEYTIDYISETTGSGKPKKTSPPKTEYDPAKSNIDQKSKALKEKIETEEKRKMDISDAVKKLATGGINIPNPEPPAASNWKYILLLGGLFLGIMLAKKL